MVRHSRKQVLLVFVLLCVVACCLSACEFHPEDINTGPPPNIPLPLTPTRTIMLNPPIDGISCENDLSGEPYQIEIGLLVYVDGNLQHLPSTFGQGRLLCTYWIHAYAADADIIDVQAPSSFTPNLKEVLDIWQSTSYSSFPAGLDPSNPTGWTIWVNGTQTQASSFDQIQLGNHGVVTLASGDTSNVTPGQPSDFNWTN